ncbi:beta-galactosidase [Microbacterium amylolyticum]|uniref:Beta-galactosidase n=2 Tax=Microbacterium amylolyticum TaxID=936337 RepID=A0ABS4ZHQ1_9MICO|nr:beta-galactosidase [Microbacterium amylolyticum]MBP2436810.1 beta-galactosidase [Microbacterium amylolyticum]
MTQHRWLRTPEGTPRRISYGADYNPDQWPREVWDDDVRLMKKAGVDVVSVAIFSWAKIQPADGQWDFAWLDDVIDLMHANGIGVDLATATASPPPWLTMKHPEVLPVTADGVTLTQGGRQHWRPTSPVFREYALELVTRLAERYGDHPGVVAWHVNNELGCHNAYDYSDDAAVAFRGWLQTRYGSIEALNHAWGTAFWSQRYGSFDEILPPRTAATFPNPTQQLDFARFSSDALIDYLTDERDILNRISPDVPVTTNFMVVGDTRHADYAKMGLEIDFVSNDHYVTEDLDELAFSASLMGGIARRKPWFLMEHSTSAVNWQPINRPKRPGELIRDSLTHVAHGADAVCYFQWRQSAAGAEKFHSAMVPHGGENTRVYRDVVALGGILRQLDEVAGADRGKADVAILFDWESWWGAELDSHPTDRLRYRREALNWWKALVNAGIRADVVPVAQDVSEYRLVIAPVLYSVSGETRDRLTAYVEGGGHLVTTYFSGIVDENDHPYLGGYPGAFRDLLGVRVEEFRPLWDGETVALSNGQSGDLWSEPVEVTADEVEVLVTYVDGDEIAGGPAVTRRPVGTGSATYVSTRLGMDGVEALLPVLLPRAGVESELPQALRGRVELVTREGDRRYDFLINRTDDELSLAGLTGEYLVGTETLPPRGVAVLAR